MNKEVFVRSVNISTKKGTKKTPVESIKLNHLGVSDDAHAGKWHRQVSLLAVESLKKAEVQNNMQFKYGDFAENITTEGLELQHTNILDRFICNDIILEVTQIGKKCHKGCEIMKITGDCVMPKEGIFCRVLHGGTLTTGSVFNYVPKTINIKIITLSDRAYTGEYEDKSGPAAENLLIDFFKAKNRKFYIEKTILPDNPELLENAIQSSTLGNSDLIITTGGTGIGPRDITPDVVKPLLDKEIPGLMEHIRIKYGSEKPNALISRSIAGVIGKTLLYVLPGSVKAVNEYFAEISKTIEHSLRMLHGIDVH